MASLPLPGYAYGVKYNLDESCIRLQARFVQKELCVVLKWK